MTTFALDAHDLHADSRSRSVTLLRLSAVLMSEAGEAAEEPTEYWNKKQPLWPRKTHFPKGFVGSGTAGGEKRGKKCVCQKQPTYV